MNVSYEDKKKEAIKRMKSLKLLGETVELFDKENIVSRSETALGIIFWADDDMKEKIAEFEDKYNALVYHVIRTYYKVPESDTPVCMDAFLYVSDYEDEWEMDRDDIRRGSAVAYVGGEDPFEEEFGSIGIERTVAAGLRRTW